MRKLSGTFTLSALALLITPSAFASETAAPGQADDLPSFTRALEHLEAGELREACEVLEAVTKQDPTAAQAHWARQLGTSLFRLSPGDCLWARTIGGDMTRDGTAELVTSQAVVAPIWLASAPGIWGRPPESATGPVLLSFTGLALGIGGTYAATREWQPTTGQAMSIYTGELLGGWYGIWIAGLDRVPDEPVMARAGHVGVLLGGLGGLALGSFASPTSGQMALARSGAIWGTTYGGLTAIMLNTESRGTFASLGLGTTVGVGAGILIGQVMDLRRGQVNTVNLGGYAGTVFGLGTALLLSEATVLSPESGAAIVGIGTTAGLVVGALLVDQHAQARESRFSLRTSPPVPTVLPTGDGGHVPGIAFSGQF
ncbi:MAG: hypothetical protein EA397_00780 [Deltaproteobacteria bacterium]|nr:MAG: hypothetical protein EA397_00780 [Deltaproteobacteria bacterium]